MVGRLKIKKRELVSFFTILFHLYDEYHTLYVVFPDKRMKVLVSQSCLTCYHPMDCSSPGSSVHRNLQARILEWVAIPSPVDFPDPGTESRPPALQADSLSFEPPVCWATGLENHFLLLPLFSCGHVQNSLLLLRSQGSHPSQ